MSPIRVLLVDDNLGFLEAMTRFLAREQLDIVGRSHNGSEALGDVDRLKPDLVLIDIAMPHMNGLEATRRIKARPGAPRVVILTLHDNPAYLAEAQAAGADGFVAKTQLGAQLMPLVRALFSHREERPSGPSER